MAALDPRVARMLDDLVPPRPAPSRWEAIVTTAGPPRSAGRRWLIRAVAIAGLATAGLVLALAWPFGGGPRGTILERAAAAVGDGPVLHVVIQNGWGGTLINLETGARTEQHGEEEIWYDPHRGVHDIQRFAGVVQGDQIYPPGRVSFLDKTLSGLATGYREALQKGTARVLGRDVVNGSPVYWIRVDSEMLPDVADHKLHEWAHDVAVSQDTYEPVATRETRDGKMSPDGISIVLDVQTFAEGDGNFTRITPDTNGLRMMMRWTGALKPSEASAVLGRPALWAGPSVAGLDLARIWRDERREDRAGTPPKTFTGVTFFYGTLSKNGVAPGLPSPGATSDTPFVQIGESRTLDFGFQRGVHHYSPPEGSILVFGSSIAVMQKDGVYLALEASSRGLLLAAARTLAPVPG